MSGSDRCLLVEIPILDYREALDFQWALVEMRHRGALDAILLLEHPPVFTLGRRGCRDGFMVTESFLNKQDIPMVHAERGGDVTYHGPGQLVAYPIMDLRASGWKVVNFVGALEQVMINAVAYWGIEADRNSLNRGAWVGSDKIGSVGIAVRRGISFHGFALNVNTSLTPFQWIHPCGLAGVQATSMERLLGHKVPMEHIRTVVKRELEHVLRVELEPVSLMELQELLGRAPVEEQPSLSS